MPVLYGVFLYMGVASLSGIQVSAYNLFQSLLPPPSGTALIADVLLWFLTSAKF